MIESKPAHSIINRSVDFWLLGGASIALWAVMLTAQLFRDQYDVIGNHFLQVAGFFSIMSLVCNHPHFMISYRFGYGRGTPFILKHWFSLLAVPIGLIALFILAYCNYDFSIRESPLAASVSHFFTAHPMIRRWDDFNNFGTESLAFAAGLMFITVGWHYSKQVFGCMMVYAKYDEYPLTPFQRKVIKASVFAIAWFSFLSGVLSFKQYGNSGSAKFFNIPLASYPLPLWLLPFTGVCIAIFSSLTVFLVFVPNYRKYKKIPSLNFLISWIAFHIWWIPIIPNNEFYIVTVPFFHSLQYLPFAYRLESPRSAPKNISHRKLYSKIALLLFIGFMAFELGPSMLDRHFDTFANKGSLFFLISFVIFINVHHFFIDSVVWKFNLPEVRKNLLFEN